MDIKKYSTFSQYFRDKYFKPEVVDHIEQKIKEMAKIHAENKDCLIAKFIEQNPDIPIKDIILIEDRSNPFKTIFYVSKRSQ